jgi:hypothetical protein
MATRCRHVECDLANDDCPNNLSTAERGSARKRHTTLVGNLRKAWKKGKTADLVDLKAKRLDLCEWYDKATGINFHCQLAQPERAQEFEEWQVEFDRKHYGVLENIDLELQGWPDLDSNPKLSESSKSNVDPTDDSQVEPKSSGLVVSQTPEQMFANFSQLMTQMNENTLLILSNQITKESQNTLQSLAKVEENTLQTLSKRIMEVEERTAGIVDTRLSEFKVSMSEEVGKVREDVSKEIEQVKKAMSVEIGTKVAEQLNGVIEESQKTAKQIRDLSGEIKSSRDQILELEKRAVAFKEAQDQTIKRNLDGMWQEIDQFIERVMIAGNGGTPPARLWWNYRRLRAMARSLTILRADARVRAILSQVLLSRRGRQIRTMSLNKLVQSGESGYRLIFRTIHHLNVGQERRIIRTMF